MQPPVHLSTLARRFRRPPAAGLGLLSAWARDWGGALTIAFGVYNLLFLLWQVFGWGGDEYRPLIADLSFLPLGLAAVVLAHRVSRHPALDPRTRRAWQLAALAYLSYFVGDALWSYFELVLQIEPFPSWADAAYLTFYPLALWSLLTFPQARRTGAERLRLGLDVLIVLLGGSMLIWHLVLRPTALAEGSTPLASLLAGTYVVGDLVLLFGIVVVLLRRPAPDSRGALALLVASLVLFLMADLAFAHLSLQDAYHAGAWPDALWLNAAYLLLISAHYQWRHAGRAGRPAPLFSEPPGWTRWLPYLAVATGFGLVVTIASDHALPPLGELIIAAAALTGLVLIRQLLLLGQNTRLLQQQATLTAELGQREARFRLAAQCASDLIYEWDIVTNRLEWFGAIDEQLGYLAGEFPRTIEAWTGIIHPDERERVLAALERHLSTGEPFAEEYRVTRRDGTYLFWTDRGAALRDADGRALRMIGATSNITERKRAEAQLAHQAFHDALTGLPNRALLRDRLGHALARARRQGTTTALLFLDLDNFKVVNDSLGHEAGDDLLVAVAERLRAVTRLADTVARLGGDEFTILLEDVTAIGDATSVAERVTAALQAPFSINGHELFVSTSIGIALSEYGLDQPEALLRGADVALYRAKRCGKAGYQVFEASMQAAAVQRLVVEHDLRRALERDEFHVYYQPVIELSTGQVRGVEALVRWQHPERGLLAPVEFIPLAEETGLIVPIGQWVLATACRQVQQWQAQRSGEPPMRLSVNLSAREFRQPALVADLTRLLLETRVQPGQLMLEITESLMMEDAEATTVILHELKTMGVRLALDDFGTGYSSLAYLKRFPVDALKIDRSFIRGLEHDRESQALVSAVIAAAAALQLTVTAEGVETAAQAAVLRDLGCGYGQGFYFAKPAPPETIGALLGTPPRRLTVQAEPAAERR